MRAALAILALAACDGSNTAPVDAAPTPDAAATIEAPPGAWTWVPLEGMRCADGSPTGIGVNLSEASRDVVVFMAGGGACWDAATCFAQKTSVHIEGGYGQADFEGEIAGVGGAFFFQRVAGNALRDASYVYVPYCTGDLHAGTNIAMHDATHAVHHVGRTNTATLLARVSATRPTASSVFLVGASAGGYGVAFSRGIARAAWPAAKVHVLADSAPLVSLDAARWAAMQAAWKPTFPATCTNCEADLGAMTPALRATTGERYALLASARDEVISQYFLLSGEALATATLAAQASMHAADGQAAFVLAGTGHVLLATPTAKTSTNVQLSTWVDQWVRGDGAWTNAGP